MNKHIWLCTQMYQGKITRRLVVATHAVLALDLIGWLENGEAEYYDRWDGGKTLDLIVSE